MMGFKTDLDALILGVLQGGSLHGYEIAKRIRQASASALRVGEGQLYPALHRLEEEGLIAATWEPQEGKPARKTYTLTGSGLAELDRRRGLWEQFAAGVGSILRAPGLAEEGRRG